MRPGIRSVPWILAVAGLGLPMLAGNFVGWPYVVLWGVLLIVPWIVTREHHPAGRRERMRLPAFLLPVLLLLGFIGGWYLIPADLAWLLIEFSDGRRDTTLPAPTAGP